MTIVAPWTPPIWIWKGSTDMVRSDMLRHRKVRCLQILKLVLHSWHLLIPSFRPDSKYHPVSWCAKLPMNSPSSIWSFDLTEEARKPSDPEKLLSILGCLKITLCCLSISPKLACPDNGPPPLETVTHSNWPSLRDWRACPWKDWPNPSTSIS